MLQTPKSRPDFFPEVRSSAGITTPSIVPGMIVLRMTTVWRAALSRIASPICSQTRSM